MRALFLSSALVSCFASLAHAQESTTVGQPHPTQPQPSSVEATSTEPASPEPSQPVETQPTSHMSLSVAPPAPALQRKDYLHEGFYFRLNMGAGYGHADLSTGGRSDSGDAFALGVDLMIGGSPAPGVTFGGAAITNTLFGTPLLDKNRTQFQFTLGPFFDVYPRNKSGFHFGAAAGFSGTTLQDLPTSAAFGGGGAAFLGYDFWVAPEWAAGFLIRGSGAYMGGNDVGTSTFGVVAALNLIYN
jgi:hypothetical protein